MRVKRVNLHTHSLFSDGLLTPEGVVDLLAASGVRYASLTDHDTVAGLEQFREALHQANIGFIPGVEITTFHQGQEFHLLAYGFDLADRKLNALLDTIRQAKPVETQGVVHNLRKSSTTSSNGFNGFAGVDEVIRVIHQAGGLAFLAHPIESCGDLAGVARRLRDFSAMGLDGLEVWYGAYTQQLQQELASLADEFGLITCAGTDLHTHTPQLAGSHAVDMPEEAWSKFLKAVLHGITQSSAQAVHAADARPKSAPSPHRFRRRYYILRIVLPVLFTIALFTTALWGFILPAFEESLLDRKREMISELTNSAWSILAAYEQNERDGLLTREEAQQQAIVQIQAMRYGKEGKDYFWLQDMTPRIIMHPYRTDLIGEDVSNFQDPLGVRIFVEFSNLVRQKGEGYIKYVWQWKDDPSRLEAKESFVKGFEPWGWIIGTGLYVEDVQAEIARIETRIVNIALLITGSLVVLMLFIAAQGIQVERKRIAAEDGQRESTEKFRSLVEAATEGVLLVLGGRCRYANGMLLDLLGYTAPQFELLDLEDVLPRTDENAAAWESIQDQEGDRSFEGLLRTAEGSLIECAITISSITAEGHQGHVFTVRPIGVDQQDRRSEGERLWQLGEIAQTAAIAIFRARPTRRGALVELNKPGMALYEMLIGGDPSHPDLETFFRSPEEFESFLVAIGKTADTVIYDADRILKDGRSFSFTLQAVLQRNENGEPEWIDGTIVDTTQYRTALRARDTQIKGLESQLAFLFKPLSSIEPKLVTCPLNTSVAAAAQLMSERDSSAIIVAGQTGTPLGIVTDQAMRERLADENLTAETPVQHIMTSPIPRIDHQARVYEAFMLMEKLGIRHLAVEGDDGKLVNLVEAGQLLRLSDRGISFAAAEIRASQDRAAIIEITHNLPDQVRGALVRDDDPVEIARQITSVADAVTIKLVEMGIAELGEPPCEFSFMAVGSQGRQEMTSGSDQDNAIIYRDLESTEKRTTAQEYFLKLGRLVCDGLHQAGFDYCQGQNMASNPRWVLPARSWKSVFREWILKPEPREILDFSIFFDLRSVYGDENLVKDLVDAIQVLLNDQPIFFTHMARNLMQQKPSPVETGNLDDADTVTWSVKSYQLPIAGFARLYALQQNIRETNTITRLDRLAELGVLHPHSQLAYSQTYSFLLKKRLAHQVYQTASKRSYTHPPELHVVGESEMQQIHDGYDQITWMLKRVSQDFLGGMQP